MKEIKKVNRSLKEFANFLSNLIVQQKEGIIQLDEAEITKYILQYLDTVIVCYDIIHEAYKKVIGKPFAGLEKTLIELKRYYVEFSGKLLTSIDMPKALLLINELIYKINTNEVLTEIAGKEISKWEATNKKHLGYISENIEIKNRILSSQQTATTEQKKPNFKNNFDNISPLDIYKHFKAGLVEKGYLTEQELNEYLKAAFELKIIPEKKFKIKDAPTKAAIEAVFYTYYKNVAGKIHGKQNQYAALLGNYFEGYKTATVSSNFSKSVY